MNCEASDTWKTAAADAAEALTTDRLTIVTNAWAAARHEYLRLCDSQAENVHALRNAARRYQQLGEHRRALARDLHRDDPKSPRAAL